MIDDDSEGAAKELRESIEVRPRRLSRVHSGQQGQDLTLKVGALVDDLCPDQVNWPAKRSSKLKENVDLDVEVVEVPRTTEGLKLFVD